jgi:transmembrane sensor
VSAPDGPVKPLPIAAAIVPSFGRDRRERLLDAVHARVARTLKWRARLVTVAVLLLLCLGGGITWRAFGQGPRRIAEVNGQSVRFSDGSSVRLLDRDAVLDVGSASASVVEVTLRTGSAEFTITPNPARRFVVHAGAADVTVLGTQFTVTREAARVRVAVIHGRVAVAYMGGATVLTDGESNWFPRAEPLAPPPVTDAAPPAASSAPPPKALAPAAPEQHVERRRYIEHVSRGEYGEAYAAIQRRPDLVGDDAADLLRAADAARFSGHPLEATRYLERVVREHARDSVAPLAAFTLGRIELSQLGHPTKAADAFARAYALAPQGSLAEDALAREVEASEAAGDHERARKLAGQYLARFPHGRRAESVRKSAGLLDQKPSGE